MNKYFAIFTILMFSTGAFAGKKSSKIEANHAQVEVPAIAPAKKEPLRNIARETISGRTIGNKEQAVFLEEDINQTADDVSMIRYTITIFKDKKSNRYSMGDWDRATRNVVRKFREVTPHDNFWVNDVVNDIYDALYKAFEVDGPRSGIHAELKIQMSSGERPSDCKCGKKCRCDQHYAGNCPCSLETANAYPAEIRVSCLDRKK